MRQQVPDDVITTSHDFSEKHTSQNAINTKLGQYVLGEKKMWISMRQQVPWGLHDDVTWHFWKTHFPNAINMKLGQ